MVNLREFMEHVGKVVDELVPPTPMDKYCRFVYKAIDFVGNVIYIAASPFVIVTLGIVDAYQKIAEVFNDHMEDE